MLTCDKVINGKVALITSITGPDGAYLSELLLEKGYTVHGLKRRSASFSTGHVEHLYYDPHEQIQPDEIYNLVAQGHVKVSFETAEYSANADSIGMLRLFSKARSDGGAE